MLLNSLFFLIYLFLFLIFVTKTIFVSIIMFNLKRMKTRLILKVAVSLLSVQFINLYFFYI